ncbi:MAG: hypothetical protein COW55_14705 [Rhodobacteraceae bacterium CG17_big_fil_post_rev_8_21_14_2_50_65_11]|nr:MAG: hypothetical protein COW55_14705 [Rhodobacteraceae bacterium CG17_big_fil_post_rev_8_21_14_2_50_65_11]
MWKRLLTAALLFGCAATAPPALAQSLLCGPRPAVTASLARNRGEHLAGAGVQTSRQVIELWISQETNSFTVLLTLANGASCLIANGEDFFLRQPAEMVMGTPS